MAENGADASSIISKHKESIKMAEDSVHVNGQGVDSDSEKGEKYTETNEEPEFKKQWEAVKSDPQDFTAWTYLLQNAEQSNIETAREAFDAFFKLYPYCYGYWKKYADTEKKSGNIDACQRVYERGLSAIPLSVDLWLHYINYYKSSCDEPHDDEMKQHIRGLFERSISAAGMEFRSDKLWEMFISWETENKQLTNVTNIYNRLLKTPTIQYSQHFDNFKDFVNENEPKEFLSAEEITALKKSLVKDDEDSEIDDSQLQKAFIEQKEEIFKKNETEVGKRWSFEEGIKRPYFHVKALEMTQLQNWKDYLDFEIKQGDRNRTVLLFERCLIACALYEEIWIKYAKYYEDSIDDVRSIFKRACTIHLPKKSSVHLSWSAFEESQGNHNEALEILINLEQSLPGLLEVTVRRINFERRRGNESAVQQLYEHCIENAPTDNLKSHFSLKYARYCFKVLKNPKQATTVVENALKKDKANTQLYMQLIDLAYHSSPPNEALILETFEEAISCDGFNFDDKLIFSQRRLEFLEDFGSDIKIVIKCQESHEVLSKQSFASKKRANEESAGGEEKKAKVETSPDAYSAPPVAPQAPTDPANSYNYNSQVSWQSYPNTYGYQQSTWNQYPGYYPTA